MNACPSPSKETLHKPTRGDKEPLTPEPTRAHLRGSRLHSVFQAAATSPSVQRLQTQMWLPTTRAVVPQACPGVTSPGSAFCAMSTHPRTIHPRQASFRPLPQGQDSSAGKV